MIIHCELDDDETKLLVDILGHTNYDAGKEAEVFTSMYKKLTQYNK